MATTTHNITIGVPFLLSWMIIWLVAIGTIQWPAEPMFRQMESHRLICIILSACDIYLFLIPTYVGTYYGPYPRCFMINITARIEWSFSHATCPVPPWPPEPPLVFRLHNVIIIIIQVWSMRSLVRTAMIPLLTDCKIILLFYRSSILKKYGNMERWRKTTSSRFIPTMLLPNASLSSPYYKAQYSASASDGSRQER